MQESKGGKTKGNSGKENRQDPKTKEGETKVHPPLHNTITPIPATMGQTRVVEEEVEAVTQVGDQTGETLSTHKSR